jgi:hypothetical protein
LLAKKSRNSSIPMLPLFVLSKWLKAAFRLKYGLFLKPSLSYSLSRSHLKKAPHKALNWFLVSVLKN